MHNVRVLILDESPQLCETLTHLAAECFIRAEFSWQHPGEMVEVRKRFDEWHPTVALLDLFVEGVDSFELLSAYLAPRLPVITMAENNVESLAQRSKERGAALFMPRNENPEALLELLEKLEDISSPCALEQ